MKRGILPGSVALLLFAGLAPAQYVDFDVARRGWTLPGAHPSVRLAGMGGLVLAVRDENNEINVSDFGDNLSGIGADRQNWTVESWGGRVNNIQDRNTSFLGDPIRQRNRFDQQSAGLDVVYRAESRRALGGTMVWTGHDVRARYGPNSRVRGPGYRFFYNETIGPVAAAVGISLHEDNEDVVSSDIFAIRHISKTRALSLAASAPLPAAGLVGAAQVDFERVRIEGISADPGGFHGDRFDWRRPTTRYRLALLLPEGSGRFAAGVKYDLVRRTGREEAEIRWSDRFPANASHVNFSADVPIFEEEENAWEAQARASFRLTPALLVAGSVRKSHFESDVREAPETNFLGSRRGGEAVRDSWRAAGGSGLTLLEQRLRLGVEAGVEGAQDEETRPRVATSVDSRRFHLRAGAEYLLPSRLALRLGYQRASRDEDVDQPGTLRLSNGGTVGVGYTPRGGSITLDAAARLWEEKPDQAGEENWKAESADLAVSARVLF